MSNFKWGVILAIGAFFISVFLGIISGVALIHIILRAIIFTILFFGLGFGLRFLVNSFFPELLYSSDDTITADSYASQAPNVNITLDNSGEYAVPELYKSNDPHEMGNIDDLISGVFRPRNYDEPKAAASAAYGAGAIDRKAESGYNTEDSTGVPGFSQGSPAESPADDLLDMFGGSFMTGSSVAEPAELVNSEETSEFKPMPEPPRFTPSFGDDSGLGGLPDLDMMAMAFSSAYSSGSTPAPPPAASSSVSTSMSPPMSSSMMPASTMPASTMPAPAFEEYEPRRTNLAGNKPETLQGDFNPKDLAKGISTILNKDK